MDRNHQNKFNIIIIKLFYNLFISLLELHRSRARYHKPRVLQSYNFVRNYRIRESLVWSDSTCQDASNHIGLQGSIILNGLVSSWEIYGYPEPNRCTEPKVLGSPVRSGPELTTLFTTLFALFLQF